MITNFLQVNMMIFLGEICIIALQYITWESVLGLIILAQFNYTEKG